MKSMFIALAAAFAIAIASAAVLPSGQAHAYAPPYDSPNAGSGNG